MYAFFSSIEKLRENVIEGKFVCEHLKLFFISSLALALSPRRQRNKRTHTVSYDMNDENFFLSQLLRGKSRARECVYRDRPIFFPSVFRELWQRSNNLLRITRSLVLFCCNIFSLSLFFSFNLDTFLTHAYNTNRSIFRANSYKNRKCSERKK